MRETTPTSTARILFFRFLLGAGLLVGSLVLGTTTQVGLRAQGEHSDGGGRHALLRSGQVISGQVTPLGDRTRVVLPSGGEVSLPTRDILLTCQTLSEAYEYLAERVEGRRTAEPFLELARWCLRYELLEEAERSLAQAREFDRKQPALAVLERQLESARRQAALPPAPLPSDKVAASRPLPPNDHSSHHSTPQSNSATRRARTHPPTTEELEAAVRSIPREGVELFGNTIQPMMWNKCGTNRCHDVGGPSDFIVLRPANGKQVWRRLSLRNLHSLLGYVDREDPRSSPLLVKSRTPHGGDSVPPLGGEESLYYQQLRIWVEGVAGRRGDLAGNSRPGQEHSARSLPQIPAVSRASFESPIATDATTESMERIENFDAEDLLPPRKSTSANQDFDGEEEPGTKNTGETTGENDNAPYRPRDPFDPEVFNRKYLRR
jgi:hypothetical protein